jgi:dethiobiotin synthetase
MNKGCFITGTDTGVGKTLVTAGLIRLFAKEGVKVAGMKPVASGCELTDQGLRNEDAIMIMQESNVELDYDLINPYAFEPPVSPHFAASESDREIKLDHIIEKYKTISTRVDYVVVEGVGGWEVPINDSQNVSDLAEKLNLPVILVVGLRLGCINHALLTVDAIRQKGLSLVACVASQIDADYQRLDETLETLEKRLGLPVQLIPQIENAKPEQITQYLEETKNQINENI